MSINLPGGDPIGSDPDPKGDVLPPTAVTDPSEDFNTAMRTLRLAADIMIREGIQPFTFDGYATPQDVADGDAAVQAWAMENFYRKTDVIGSGGNVDLGDPLESFGTVDKTEGVDMAPLINSAIIDTANAQRPLYIGPGRYRLNSPLIMRSNMHVIASPAARFVGYFNAGGQGIWYVPSAPAAANPLTRERNIRIEGGIWGFKGAGLGQAWVGEYTGNVVSAYVDDAYFDRMWMDGYGPGRAFLIAGNRVFLDRILCTRAPAIGGAGGIRYFGGTTFRCTNSYVESGDDAFQLVPGGGIGGVWADISIKDAIYSNCQGYSYEGRLMAVGLTTQDRADVPILVTLATSINAVQTTIPVVSKGLLLPIGRRILVKATNEVMQVSVAPTLDTLVTVTRGVGGTTAAAVVVGEDNPLLTADIGLMTLSGNINASTTTIPVTSGALALVAGYVVAVRATGELMQVASTPTIDTSFTVVRGFGESTPTSVTVGSQTSILQWNSAQFRLTSSIEDSSFIGIQGRGGGSSFTIQNTDSSGYIRRLTYTDCVIDDFGNDDRPMAVVVLGRLGGVREITFNNLQIRGSFRQAVEINGVCEDITFRGGSWEKARTPDRSTVRIKGGKNIIIDDVTLFAPDDSVFDALVIGGPDAVDNNGLLVRGSAVNVLIENCTLRNIQNDQFGIVAAQADNLQVIRCLFQMDPSAATARGVQFGGAATNGWVDRCDFRECGHATPLSLGGTNNTAGTNLGVPGGSLGTLTSTQGADTGTLVWSDNIELIRVTVSGFVLDISGTPDRAVKLTIRSVNVLLFLLHGTVKLAFERDIRLNPGESVTLMWDVNNAWWFQIAGKGFDIKQIFLVDDYGAVGNGVTDDSGAFQLAINACEAAGGGVVYLGPNRYYINVDITVKAGVVVEGAWETAGKKNNADYSTQNYVILLSSTARIRVLGSAGFRKCGIFRQGTVKPANNVRAMMNAKDAFAGVGIEAKGDDTIGSVSECVFEDMTILGFDLGIDIYRGECHSLARLLIDCTAGFKMERIRDIARLEHIHMWPAVTAHQTAATIQYPVASVANAGGLLQLTLVSSLPGANTILTGDRVNVVLTTGGTLRKRTAITIVNPTTITCNDIPWDVGYTGLSGTVWPGVFWREGVGATFVDHEAISFFDVFAYGHATGIQIDDTDPLKIASWLRAFAFGYDNDLASSVDSAVAIDIIGNARGMQFIGGETNSCGLAIRVNTPSTLHHKFQSMQLNCYTNGRVFDLIDGNVIIDSCETSVTSTASISAVVDDVVFGTSRFKLTTVTSAAPETVVFLDGATKFANRIKGRSEPGQILAGAPGVNTAIIIDQAGSDANQGSQIQWGSGATKMYERVLPSGVWELVNSAYSAITLQVTNSGVVTIPTMSVTGNGTVTGNLTVSADLTVGDDLTVTGDASLSGRLTVTPAGTVIIGNATAGGGPSTALHMRGDPTADPGRAGEIRFENITANLSHYVRESSTGNWTVVNNTGALGIAVTQAGRLVVNDSMLLGASADLVGEFTGTGSPEGVVAAGVSSTFKRRDGGTGTSQYIKESGGTGNTGWVPIASSSGGVTDGDKGDIVVTSSGATWTIDNNSVTDVKLRDSAALSVIGRSANSAGDPADIAAGTDGHVLRRSGTTVDFGLVGTLGIADAAVTLAKQADIATARLVGRATAGTGVPESLTGAQVTALLEVFTGTLKGVVPASGGGTTDFLRADGSWVPPGGGGSPGGSSGQVQLNNAGVFGGSSGLILTSTDARFANWFDTDEISTPAAPAVDRVRQFVADSARLATPFVRVAGEEPWMDIPSFFGCTTSYIGPGGGTTISTINDSVTSTGTVSHATPASTNRLTTLRRAIWTPTAAANAQAGVRSTTAHYHIGGGSDRGGFILWMRGGTNTANNETAAFFGLSSAGAALGADDASSNLANAVGIYRVGGASPGTNWRYCERTGSGVATTVDLGQAFTTAGGDIFDLYYYVAPGGTGIGFRVVFWPALGSGPTELLNTTLNTTIPAATTFLAPHLFLRAGATSFAPVPALAGIMGRRTW